MKNLVDVLVDSVVCNAQQACFHENRLAGALDGLDAARAAFGDWLRVYLNLDEKKRTVTSCADMICQPDKVIACFCNAQEIIAAKLVVARKNKHQALLFSVLRRHSEIVRRVYAELHPRRRRKTYRVVTEEVPEVTVLKA